MGMRWIWDYLDEIRVLNDTQYPIYIPGSDCVQIKVVREVDTGMPPNENELESRVQQSAGRVWLFNYLDARVLRLTLSLFGKSPGDIGATEIIRAKRVLAQWFNPQPTAPDGILTFEDSGTTRAIKARYDSGLEYDWLYTDQGEFVTDVRLLCPNPLWYDPVQQSEAWGETGNSLELCYTLPYTLCEGVGTTQYAINAGDWATYPIITVNGPAFDVTVQNTTTDEKISATYSIPAGKSVVYDFTPGVKTIFDSDGNNLVSTLVQPNDLARFHLACAYEYDENGNQVAPELSPALPAGTNAIVVTSGASVTTANMTWYNRYLTN